MLYSMFSVAEHRPLKVWIWYISERVQKECTFAYYIDVIVYDPISSTLVTFMCD